MASKRSANGLVRIVRQLTICSEYILQSIINHAKTAITPFQDPGVAPPDASFVLQLPDEVFTGSSLYAVQKTFEGPFQFDIIYENANVKQKLTGGCSSVSLNVTLFMS